MKKDNLVEQLKKENILLIGFAGKTGISVADYMLKRDISISISDTKSKEYIKKLASSLEKNKKIKNIFSGTHKEQLKDIDKVILSPGVPRSSPLIKEALRRKITVLGEIELAIRLCPTKDIIGITGTDGKSTTVTLLHKILKDYFQSQEVNSREVILGGNIGVPFISFVDELKKNSIVVLELSSYMLEGEPIPLAISCILNIDFDHMDRYSSFECYLEAKKNIFKGQTKNDYCILNEDDPHLQKLIRKQLKPNMLTFSLENKNATIFEENNTIFFEGKEILSIKDIPLKGIHNKENILAATLCALIMKVPIEYIKQSLDSFPGLEHRNEYLGKAKGITFINDSKATTTQAVKKALISQNNNNVILLMGGQNKNLKFDTLKPYIKQKTKALILFGEARFEINDALMYQNTHLCKDLGEAFKKALTIATIEDVVMLSPACTSFDQFRNYKERGKYFKSLVREYTIS